MKFPNYHIPLTVYIVHLLLPLLLLIKSRDDAMIASRREADELRQLLSEGTAPGPPRFWSAKIGHPDVGEDDDALTEELLLCWKPQPGSAVSARACAENREYYIASMPHRCGSTWGHRVCACVHGGMFLLGITGGEYSVK